MLSEKENKIGRICQEFDHYLILFLSNKLQFEILLLICLFVKKKIIASSICISTILSHHVHVNKYDQLFVINHYWRFWSNLSPSYYMISKPYVYISMEISCDTFNFIIHLSTQQLIKVLKDTSSYICCFIPRFRLARNHVAK